MRPEGGTNLSRRRFLSFGAGAVVLGVLLPSLPERTFAAVPNAGPVKPGTRAPAFLVIGKDNSVKLLSPFVEGGQGISTGQAQIVGEELDVNPSRFIVNARRPAPTMRWLAASG